MNCMIYFMKNMTNNVNKIISKEIECLSKLSVFLFLFFLGGGVYFIYFLSLWDL